MRTVRPILRIKKLQRIDDIFTVDLSVAIGNGSCIIFIKNHAIITY